MTRRSTNVASRGHYWTAPAPASWDKRRERRKRVRDMARTKKWMQTNRATRPKPPDDAEKQRIVAACEAFIVDVLKPRFLPQIRPTEWNYVIDIHGAWAGGRYRFVRRFRSGHKENRGQEFHAPFARIDRMG